jgi:exosortase
LTVAGVLTRHRPACLVALAGFAALFWPTLAGLVESWVRDPDLAFCFFIPPISAAILFGHRKTLAGVAARTSVAGLGVALLSLVVFLGSYVTFTNSVQRLAAWGTAIGAVWFTLGSAVLLAKPFPFLFLLLSIPIPEVLLGPLRLTLKEIATRLSADLLGLLGWSVAAQGNVLVLDGLRLEVADACSGVRSLTAMAASAVLLAYVLGAGWAKGSLLLATAIPLTVLLNVLRVVLMAVCLKSFDLDLTQGIRHQVLGYATFGASLGLLYASWRFYDWLLAWRPGGAP